MSFSALEVGQQRSVFVCLLAGLLGRLVVCCELNNSGVCLFACLLVWSFVVSRQNAINVGVKREKPAQSGAQLTRGKNNPARRPDSSGLDKKLGR